MQSYIKQDKQCDRQHDEGQDKLIAICLNPHCDKRLMCCFCYHDYHCEHVKDVKTITQVQVLCKDSIAAFDKLQLTVILQNKAEQFKTLAHTITQQLNKLVTFYMDDVQQIYTMVEELAESFVTLQKGNINALTNEQSELLATFIHEKVLENVEDVVNHIGEKMGLSELIKINDTLNQKLQLLDIQQILEKNILNEKLKQFTMTHEMNYDWIQPQFLMIRSPELQKIEYPNEDFYVGEIRDNKKFGKGLYFQKVAQTYQLGVFRDDKFLWGQSLMVVNKKYWIKQGKWVNGKIEGKGTHVLLSGEMYQGDLRSDIRDGFGIMKYATGDEYQGQWRMGLFNGKGLYKYANGDEYEGDYVNDKKEGIGSYQYKNGELYVGQFYQGLRHGSAIVKFPNGDIYTGDYSKDKKDGPGVYRYVNGNIFEGDYKNGVRHGNGIFTDVENETREIGLYVDGLQEGEHLVFKLLKDKPYSVNIYEKGKIVNSRSL